MPKALHGPAHRGRRMLEDHGRGPSIGGECRRFLRFTMCKSVRTVSVALGRQGDR